MPSASSHSEHVLAFDLGGSHISAGLCQLTGPSMTQWNRAGLPADLTGEHFADLVFSLSRELTPDLASLASLAGAVFAVPGPFDFAAGISQMRHKLQSLFGVPLRPLLAERFGWRQDQFYFLNDAGAFLLGEVTVGAAQGAARAVGITLGTGIGSAFAMDGRWIANGPGVPPGGEIWNFAYRGGTVEDLLSTRALQADFARRTGAQSEVASIARLADSGSDPAALQVFQDFGVTLGSVFRDVLGPFSPQVVVIGGGISRSAHLFLPAAEQELTGLAMRLVPSTLLDRAPLLGAAAYWNTH